MFHKRNLLRDEILKLLKNNAIIAQRYLDIGCGDGILTSIIAKKINAKEVYGADVNYTALKKLPASIKGVFFDFEKLSSDKLQFDQEHFDIVTAIEFIEHLSYGDDFLAEVYRLLTSKGYLLITTPNLASMLNRFLLLFGYQPLYTAPSRFYHIGLRNVSKKFPISENNHKNLYTYRALMELLKLNNFEIVETVGAQSTYDLFSFLPVASFPSIASNVIVLCRKNK